MTPEQFLEKFLPGFKFVAEKHIDAVLIGGCANGHPIALSNGGVLSKVNGLVLPDKEWFESQLERSEVSGKCTVLLFPECCSSFHDEFLVNLQILFPEITWLTPKVADFCGHLGKRHKMYIDALIDSLSFREFIKPV